MMRHTDAVQTGYGAEVIPALGGEVDASARRPGLSGLQLVQSHTPRPATVDTVGLDSLD